MNSSRKKSSTYITFLVLSLFFGGYFSEIFDLSFYEAGSVTLFIFFFLKIVIDIGKSVWVFVDVISLLLILTCLFVPIIFFHHFNDTNPLAVLWVKQMPISSNEYYGFTFPASMSIIIGFYFPTIARHEFKHTIKEYISLGLFQRPPRLGMILIFISLIFSLIGTFAPGSMGFVVYLFTKLLFVGLTYLFFSGKKIKTYWIILGGSILFLQSLNEGMFGELIFLSLLGFIGFTYGRNFSLFSKISVISGGIFAIFLIQSIKHEYRQYAWAGEGLSASSNISVFANLASRRIQNKNDFLSEEKLFFTAVRFNQGWIVASVMKNVPHIVPHANGETIWQSLLASIIPRFLWADKPKAGGRANIERFLRWDLKNTSMNIGLLGEGYANFGVEGGCFFLFLYGLFFQWAYNLVIKTTYSFPTLILWMPFLFYYCIGVENDLLTVINHLTKTAFFIFILYKYFPKFFNIQL